MFFWKGKSIFFPRYAIFDVRAIVRISCPCIPLPEPRFDVGVAEVEEVAGVIPDEAILVDRLAVAADLSVRFEDELVGIAEEGGGREATDARADDEVTYGFHRGVRH